MLGEQAHDQQVVPDPNRRFLDHLVGRQSLALDPHDLLKRWRRVGQHSHIVGFILVVLPGVRKLDKEWFAWPHRIDPQVQRMVFL